MTTAAISTLSANLAGKMLRDAGLVPKFTGGGTWVSSQAPGAGVPRGSTVTCATRRGQQL